MYDNTNYTAHASIQYAGGNEQFAIWSDFNDNFHFESSERIAYQLLNLTYLTNVLVAFPSISRGAVISFHRMRTTAAYAAVPDPCGLSSTYGETHDYTVNILAHSGKLYDEQ